jgi:peptidylprolyl isomerase
VTRPLSTRHTTLTLAAALALGAAAGPARAEVVARLGATELSGAEVGAFLDGLEPSERAALLKDPTLLAQAVRVDLARRAVVREAQQKHWGDRPEVKVQLDRVRDQALGELYLQAVSRPPDGYPGDEEVQAAYQANQKAFEVPRTFRVAQIYVAVAKGASPAEAAAARKKAEESKKQATAGGADFAAVARARSEEKGGPERGGEVGWLTEAQLLPAVKAIVLSLAVGQVSEPALLDDGWHVVKLLDARPASMRPLAEVREALASRLRAERTQANRQAWLAKLLEQTPPVINEIALSAVAARAR